MRRVGYSPNNNFAAFFFFLAFTTVQLNLFTTATLGTGLIEINAMPVISESLIF